MKTNAFALLMKKASFVLGDLTGDGVTQQLRKIGRKY